MTQAQVLKRIPHRMLWLLVAIVGLHVISSFVSGSVGERVTLTLFILVLASAAVAVSESRRSAIITLALGAPLMIAAAFTVTTEDLRTDLIVGTLATPFVGYTAWRVFVFILSGRSAVEDKILGAAAVYMLIGLAWAGIYAVLELASEGTFPQPGTTKVEFNDLYYFSLITMTTVGYGDITPSAGDYAETARAFASLQGMMGIFYMAVIVARFVAMFEPKIKGDSDAEGAKT